MTEEEALAFVRGWPAEDLALFTEDPKREIESAQDASNVFPGQAAAVAFGDYIIEGLPAHAEAARARRSLA